MNTKYLIHDWQAFIIGPDGFKMIIPRTIRKCQFCKETFFRGEYDIPSSLDKIIGYEVCCLCAYDRNINGFKDKVKRGEAKMTGAVNIKRDEGGADLR